MPIRTLFYLVALFLRPSRSSPVRSAITLLSVLVIALVLALSIVYTSVTRGLEERWIGQISTFWAPIRIVPTQHYFDSYFHQMHLYSGDYSALTLHQQIQYQQEKARSQASFKQSTDDSLEYPHSLRELSSEATLLKNSSSSTQGQRRVHPDKKAIRAPSITWHDPYDPLLDSPLPSYLARSRDSCRKIEHPLILLNQWVKRSAPCKRAPLLETSLPKPPDWLKLCEVCEVIESSCSWRPYQAQVHPTSMNYSFLIAYSSLPQAIADVIDAPHAACTFHEDRTTSYKADRPHSHQNRDRITPQTSSRSIPDYLSSQGVLLPSHFQHKGLHQNQAIEIFSTESPHVTTSSTPSDRASDESASSPPTHHATSARIEAFFTPLIDGWARHALIAHFDLAADLFTPQGGIASSDDFPASMHFGIWLPAAMRSQAASDLRKMLNQYDLNTWFTIKTLDDYPFCQGLIHQLRSDRILLLTVSLLILLVASTSIISMLIILVHERRHTIAIFRALGVPRGGILRLFCLLGAATGLLGAILGGVLGVTLLSHLETLAAWISWLLGHPLLSETFFGREIPNHIDLHSTLTLLIGSVILSTLSGLIAALHASSYTPHKLLQGE